MAVLGGENSQTLVLASSSAARTTMLTHAGVPHSVCPPAVDEATVKESLADAPPQGVAETLAELKARSVAGRYPTALVIGADQALAQDNVFFDKPADVEHARAQLHSLSGDAHELHSSVCVVQGGQRLWHCNDRARLDMRTLSASFIDQYLDAIGDDACRSVGAYRLEGLGAQLFTRVNGDYFTVLGMPLLPLLAFLRDCGVVPR